MRQRRVCPEGHLYYKTSDCPVCPRCEASRKPQAGMLAGLSAPAVRALQGAGLTTPKKLARQTESQVLQLHGMGPGSLPKLRAALKAQSLFFTKEK